VRLLVLLRVPLLQRSRNSLLLLLLVLLLLPQWQDVVLLLHICRRFEDVVCENRQRKCLRVFLSHQEFLGGSLSKLHMVWSMTGRATRRIGGNEADWDNNRMLSSKRLRVKIALSAVLSVVVGGLCAMATSRDAFSRAADVPRIEGSGGPLRVAPRRTHPQLDLSAPAHVLSMLRLRGGGRGPGGAAQTSLDDSEAPCTMFCQLLCGRCQSLHCADLVHACCRSRGIG
jgi:hypothetical protein